MFGLTIENKSAHPALDEAGCACFNALRQAVEAAGFSDREADFDDVSLNYQIDTYCCEDVVSVPQSACTVRLVGSSRTCPKN
jgi:hypothetical protein